VYGTDVACGTMQPASVQRLLADLREIHNSPLHLVSAAPLEDDLYTWHVNIIGCEGCPFDGGIFHLELTFPVRFEAKLLLLNPLIALVQLSYPSAPPSVRVLTAIPHPHVHGDKVKIR
jgi:ubiquitin-protein ligase